MRGTFYTNIMKKLCPTERYSIHSSVQSSSCEKSVHTQEILCRMLNTSSNLNWQEYGAHFITDYMIQTRLSGYSAANIFDSMMKDDENGVLLMYREKGFMRMENHQET